MLNSAFDLFRRAVLAGLDAQAKIFDLLDDLVEKGKIDEAERGKFIQELDERLECSREKTEEFINDIIKKVTEKSPFVCKRDLDSLRDQIANLENQLKKFDNTRGKKAEPTETVIPVE